MSKEKLPPLGVRLTVDVEEHAGSRGTSYWARIRWTHPVTHHREGMKRAHPSREAAEAWVERMQRTAATGVDTGQTLAAYVEHIGDRWTRGIDPHLDLRPLLGRSPSACSADPGAPAADDDHRRTCRPGDRRVGEGVRPVDGEEHRRGAGAGAGRGGARRHPRPEPGQGPSAPQDRRAHLGPRRAGPAQPSRARASRRGDP